MPSESFQGVANKIERVNHERHEVHESQDRLAFV